MKGSKIHTNIILKKVNIFFVRDISVPDNLLSNIDILRLDRLGELQLSV